MAQKWKWWASAALTALVALVLVADSAGPECSGTERIDVTLTWETDCWGEEETHSGTVHFVRGLGMQEQRDLTSQAVDSGLEVTAAYAAFVHCSEDGEIEAFRAIELSFPNGDCTLVNPIAAEPYLCESGEGESAQQCTFTVTAVE